METILYIVVAFVVGVVTGLFVIVSVQKKFAGSQKDDSWNKRIKGRVETINKDATSIITNFKNISDTSKLNMDNLIAVNKKFNELVRIVNERPDSPVFNTQFQPNNQQTAVPVQDNTVMYNQHMATPVQDNTAMYNQQTAVPVQDNNAMYNQQTAVPVQNNSMNEQSQKPSRVSLSMSKVFETVQKLRREGADYCVYNSSIRNFEYSSDVNSKFIMYNYGNNIFVLPNQVSPFAKKQVAENVYKCSLSFIEESNEIIPCVVDNSGNIINQGEIF
jgi:hypothetical protein